MRERVLQLGGEMRLNSEGNGTLIAITLPFAENMRPGAEDLQPAPAFE
jgi:signal transduction histidine kinase